jgi:hypothetical protein
MTVAEQLSCKGSGRKWMWSNEDITLKALQILQKTIKNLSQDDHCSNLDRNLLNKKHVTYIPQDI